MLKRLSIITFILLLASSSRGQQRADWIKVTSNGGGFSFMAPSNPSEESKVEGDYSSHSFSLKTDTTIFIIEYGDYAASIKLDSAGELAANRDNFVKTLEGKLLDSKWISLQGRSGLEFSAESLNLSVKCRVYIQGNRVFMVAGAVKKGDTDFKDVDRFIASFAFTQP